MTKVRGKARPNSTVDFVLTASKLPTLDYYKLLGVSRTAATSHIKQVYYALCLKHHPDRGGDPAAMAQLTEAYGVLRDPEKRAAYDKATMFVRKPCSTCKGDGQVYVTKKFTQRVGRLCPSCSGTGTQGGR